MLCSSLSSVFRSGICSGFMVFGFVWLGCCCVVWGDGCSWIGLRCFCSVVLVCVVLVLLVLVWIFWVVVIGLRMLSLYGFLLLVCC